MAPKGNNMIPNGHFHKKWVRFVKTWFDQPSRKVKRRVTREKKARAVAPRPAAGPLRPIVHCPSVRYHRKVRAGRGFTALELKAANINRRHARTIGIAVDRRRRNRSLEFVHVNHQRLLQYTSELIVFPSSRKKRESRPDLKFVVQSTRRDVLPYVPVESAPKARAPTQEEKAFSAFTTLRKAHADERFVGVRAKRAKEMADNGGDNLTRITRKSKSKK